MKIYNTNPQGVVTVKFREEDAALQCIQVMHGRFFGGRQIEAAMWDGIEQARNLASSCCLCRIRPFLQFTLLPAVLMRGSENLPHPTPRPPPVHERGFSGG